MFSLAVSIPYNSTTELYDTSQVADTGDQVRERIVNDCEVYNGARAVAATVLRWPNVLDQCPDKPVQWPNVLAKCGPALKTWADFKECQDAVYNGRADHAEHRTLQHFDTLVNNHNNNDLFLLPHVTKDVRMNQIP